MNRQGYGEDELNRQGRQERQEEPENPAVRAQAAEGGVMDADSHQGRRVAEPDAETDRLAQEVIGAAIEVHRALGPGFLESLYEQAMSIELGLRGISSQRQVPVAVDYKGHSIGESRLDMLVEGKLIVELKAVDQFAPIHTAQVMSYLKATGHRLGLLINFNVVRLKDGVKRVVLS
jgi:GxxExxY protein